MLKITHYYTSTAVVVSLKATKASFLALKQVVKAELNCKCRTGPQTKDGGLNSAQNFIPKVNMAAKSLFSAKKADNQHKSVKCDVRFMFVIFPSLSVWDSV